MAGSPRHTEDECSRAPSTARRRRLDRRTHGDAASAAVCLNLRDSKPFARTFVPQLCCSCCSPQLPLERSWRAMLQQLGQLEAGAAGLLAALLARVRDAGACARVAGSLVLDELRPRRSTSPCRWRASRVCALSRSRDARVMCRSRVMPCGLVCDHFYPKYIFGAPVSFCARPQLAPLHAVTGLPAHYF